MLISLDGVPFDALFSSIYCMHACMHRHRCTHFIRNIRTLRYNFTALASHRICCVFFDWGLCCSRLSVFQRCTIDIHRAEPISVLPEGAPFFRGSRKIQRRICACSMCACLTPFTHAGIPAVLHMAKNSVECCIAQRRLGRKA